MIVVVFMKKRFGLFDKKFIASFELGLVILSVFSFSFVCAGEK